MRPPTELPTLLRASRAVAAAVVLVSASFALGTTPVGAAEPPTKSLTALRAERATLIRSIARLTDRALRADRAASAARARHAVASLQLEPVRQRFAQYAVDAYVDGFDDPEEAQLRQKAWTDVVARTAKQQLLDLQRAEAAIVAQAVEADAMAAEAKRARQELVTARTELEKTITDREAEDRASRHVEVPPGVPTWAVPATRNQGQLFARFPFGPVSAIPSGLVATGQVLEGMASWYGPGFDGRRTASGAIFDQEGPTVAHKTLPLGTILLISRGDRKVLALVNDRGPYVGGRIIDLSHGVAAALGTVSAGVAHVRAEILVLG